MGKEESLKEKLIQSIIIYIRENYPDAIDKAYAYFWDEKDTDEFLSGTALALGFINFEDWLVFDYKTNDKKETFIDIYIKEKKLKGEKNELLNKIKTSNLSLYEVVSVSRDKRILIKDLILAGEFSLRDKKLTRGLKKGEMFGTRLLHLDEGYIMSGCVYPFRSSDKKKVLGYIDRMFGRYKRNENPEGTMKDFLKDYGDIINIAWMNIILNQISC
ncbi:MAG: hypothetical protein HY755_03080 [Nitrospirae bacterium]|nr:hypothetical protein [Nitrospirota bacterium]